MELAAVRVLGGGGGEGDIALAAAAGLNCWSRATTREGSYRAVNFEQS